MNQSPLKGQDSVHVSLPAIGRILMSIKSFSKSHKIKKQTNQKANNQKANNPKKQSKTTEEILKKTRTQHKLQLQI